MAFSITLDNRNSCPDMAIFSGCVLGLFAPPYRMGGLVFRA